VESILEQELLTIALIDEFNVLKPTFCNTKLGNSGSQIGKAVDAKLEKYDVLPVKKVPSILIGRLIIESGLSVPRNVKLIFTNALTIAIASFKL
jgi:hypothetical protein